MSPFLSGNAYNLPPRRSRKNYIAQSRERQLEQQADMFAKRGQIEDTFAKLEASQMPSEVIQILRMQLEAMMPHLPPEIPPDEELRAQEMESLAEQFIGGYFERKPDGGWKLWNFVALVAGATMIEQRSSGQTLAFEIQAPGVDFELTGDTAVAFLRFMHYSGLMLLESNKIPCPQCGDKEPQDCPECCGLGWVLKGQRT
jgi:hypothetical protein